MNMIIKFKLAVIACLLFCVQNVISQEKTITGLVTDGSGIPVPGATIIVQGTTNGTSSDFDGNYTLSNVSATSQIMYSYIGYTSQIITVGDQSVINVTLQESLESLDEVVVVGYGTQKKALVTGASVNVKGEAIAKLNTGTAMEALQGVTPGISITRNNGQPGAGTKVTIRGLGTVGNSNPLYVVDGVALGGGIDFLSPSDIESIDVLKDAASAAIYGTRAANGVVLVTTKKGRKGSKTRVSYDSFYGFQDIYKNLDPLNAQEYMYIIDEGRVNDGLVPNDWETILKSNFWLNDNYPGLGTQLGEEIWNNLQNGWEGTNWIDEMASKNSTISSHTVNITGGGEDNTFALGFSYFDQDGILGADLVDAGYKRLTARMNTEFVLAKNEDHSLVTVGQNITYTNTENRSVATGNIYFNDLHNALVQNPLMPAYWDQSPDQYGFTPTLDGLANDQHNPLAVMFYRSNFSNLGNKGNNIVGNVYAEFQPIKNLKLRTAYGIDTWFGQNRSWNPTFALAQLFQNDTDGVSQGQYLGNNTTWTNTISYEHMFGEHKIDVLVGNEVYKNVINTNVGGFKANSRFGSPQYAYLNNVDKSTINLIDTYGADWAAGGGGLLSYITRAQYNYKEKYLLSATVRFDASSNFAAGNKWGTFPSLSAGWILTEEDFLSSSSILDFAKLRASWGQNGNQSIPNFIYSSTLAYINPGYYFGDDKLIPSTTAIPARIPNPDVTWETSEQLNFGLDARLFNSKMALTVDWYKKTTRDWLVLAPLNITAGAAAPFINGGNVENSGVELMVSWNDEISDFKYGITVSGAYNKNEVTKLSNASGFEQGASSLLAQGTAAVQRASIGLPIGYFFGYKSDGILQNQDEVDAYVGPTGQPYFSDQRPGDVRFRDINQDGVIDEGDRVMLGNPNPDFELGIQLNAEYKGFYMNTTLAGKFGMQVMQSYRSFADRFDQNYTTQIFQRWHGEGTSNRWPRLSSTSNRNTNLISDIFMHDADYLRINNLTLGYDFSKFLTDVDFLSQLKVYATVNNLYTFTNYDGMDPEVGYDGGTGWGSGIDLGLYPQARTVMFGVNVTF